MESAVLLSPAFLCSIFNVSVSAFSFDILKRILKSDCALSFGNKSTVLYGKDGFQQLKRLQYPLMSKMGIKQTLSSRKKNLKYAVRRNVRSLLCTALKLNIECLQHIT